MRVESIVCFRVIFDFFFWQIYRLLFSNWYVKVVQKSWKTVSSKLYVAQIISYQLAILLFTLFWDAQEMNQDPVDILPLSFILTSPF